MKIEYLEELRPDQLKEKLTELGVDLTDYQYYKLYTYNCRTFLFAPKKIEKYKVNILYRITILFYFIWNIIISFIIQPIKWLITGKLYFSTNNKIYRFTINWKKKIGL